MKITEAMKRRIAEKVRQAMTDAGEEECRKLGYSISPQTRGEMEEIAKEATETAANVWSRKASPLSGPLGLF